MLIVVTYQYNGKKECVDTFYIETALKKGPFFIL